MTKRLDPRVWLIAIGLLLSAPDARAETEAEAAAESQRPLTTLEISRKEADCSLPTEGKTLAGVPSGIRAVRIEFSEQKFLALFIVDGSSASQDQRITGVFPDLPKGGIGARDLCGAAQIGIMPTHPSTTSSIVVSLRLRPGLDLAEDYPTAAAQIQQQRQILPIFAPGFALITIADVKQANGIVTQLADWAMVAPSGYFFITGNNLYVALRE